MQLLFTFIFLAFSFATGVHAYVIKNTLSHWMVSLLSGFASFCTAWTALYSGVRFFYDPSKIVLDTGVLNLHLVFTNHAPTEPVVLGNAWLLACLIPLVISVLAVRELRKLPEMQPFEEELRDDNTTVEPTLHPDAESVKI